MDQDLSQLEGSTEIESRPVDLNVSTAGWQVFTYCATCMLTLTYSTTARNVVFPVSLTRIWLGSKCISGSLLNLNMFMYRALLAINIAQMVTYNNPQVRFRLLEFSR